MVAAVAEYQQQFSVDNAELDEWKRFVDDRSDVQPLEREFPYLSSEIGAKALSETLLFDAADNAARTFKWRGAFTAARQAVDAGADSLITASAGNHARGVALAGKFFDLPTTLVVPTTAPHAKRSGIRELWPGGDLHVTPHGETFDQSMAHARRLQPEAAFIAPFDSEHTVAGQATVMRDALEQTPAIDTVVLPVGGGGLLAGISRELARQHRTDVRVVAVQAEGSNSFERSMPAGEVSPADDPNRLFGGVRVERVGQTCLDAVQASGVAVEFATVSDEDVKHLVNLYDQQQHELLRRDLPVFEPTSLLAVAALYSVKRRGETTLVLGTGKNESPLAVFR